MSTIYDYIAAAGGELEECDGTPMARFPVPAKTLDGQDAFVWLYWPIDELREMAHLDGHDGGCKDVG